MLKERDVQIAQMAIEGRSQREIAEVAGVTQQAVSKVLNKDEIKALVDQAQEIIATGAITAADNMIGAAEYFRDYLKKLKKGEKMEQDVDKQMIDYGFKASREIGKSTGSLAGDAPSVFVQNIYNDNRSIGTPPEIMQLLKARQVEIDPEYEEIGG
jgi:predicted transcriptional regulator